MSVNELAVVILYKRVQFGCIQTVKDVTSYTKGVRKFSSTHGAPEYLVSLAEETHFSMTSVRTFTELL